jgi:hypothetical protein
MLKRPENQALFMRKAGRRTALIVLPGPRLVASTVVNAARPWKGQIWDPTSPLSIMQQIQPHGDAPQDKNERTALPTGQRLCPTGLALLSEPSSCAPGAQTGNVLLQALRPSPKHLIPDRPASLALFSKSTSRRAALLVAPGTRLTASTVLNVALPWQVQGQGQPEWGQPALWLCIPLPHTTIARNSVGDDRSVYFTSNSGVALIYTILAGHTAGIYDTGTPCPGHSQRDRPTVLKRIRYTCRYRS